MSTFYRKPTLGADRNQWAPYNDAHINTALGEQSAQLYNDAGTLKIGKGRIGINDGTTTGVSIIDTVTTISMALVSNGNWAKIEMTVSGTAVTFTALDIAGATTENVLPATFLAGYDQAKVGYYLSANKRCIGVAYKDAGGNLVAVVNAFDVTEKDRFSRVRVTKNNAQTIVSGGGVGGDPAMEYDDEVWDTLGEWDNAVNYRFTATYAGYYRVTASVQLAVDLTDDLSLLSIHVNGVAYSKFYYYPDADYYPQLRHIDTVHLGIGDYLEIHIRQDTGGPVNTTADAFYNYVTIERIPWG